MINGVEGPKSSVTGAVVATGVGAAGAYGIHKYAQKAAPKGKDAFVSSVSDSVKKVYKKGVSEKGTEKLGKVFDKLANFSKKSKGKAIGKGALIGVGVAGIAKLAKLVVSKKED